MSSIYCKVHKNIMDRIRTFLILMKENKIKNTNLLNWIITKLTQNWSILFRALQTISDWTTSSFFKVSLRNLAMAIKLSSQYLYPYSTNSSKCLHNQANKTNGSGLSSKIGLTNTQLLWLLLRESIHIMLRKVSA